MFWLFLSVVEKINPRQLAAIWGFLFPALEAGQLKYSLVEILSQLGGISAIAAMLWVVLRFMDGIFKRVVQFAIAGLSLCLLAYSVIYVIKFALGLI